MTDPRPVAEIGGQRLADVLAATKYVLLDFDGPVADVFAGRPAREVADELRALVAGHIEGPLPADVEATQDPLHIVRQVAEFAPQLAPTAEAALQAAELEAMNTATLTPGVAEFLAACQGAGWPVAIVSNNSAPAIAAFLERHQLTDYVQHIAGRDNSDPRLMKPDPFLLAQASDALGADPAATVLIGDSTTDIDAARAHGVRVIGYVNKPAKTQTLQDADALTRDMADLAPT